MDEQLSDHGFWIERSLLTHGECNELANILGPLARAGRRGLLGVPGIMEFAYSPKLIELVRRHLGGEPFPVRALYFNKSAAANWSVGWHQDRAIAVRQKIEVLGFDGWSVKDGVPHVLPPRSVLERMVTLRVHLDGADRSSGALRVLAGLIGKRFCHRRRLMKSSTDVNLLIVKRELETCWR